LTGLASSQRVFSCAETDDEAQGKLAVEPEKPDQAVPVGGIKDRGMSQG